MDVSVNIYVLCGTSDAKFLYNCIKKIKEKNKNSVLVCNSNEKIETLDMQIWTASQADFITHSKFGEDQKYLVKSSCVLAHKSDVPSLVDNNPNHSTVALHQPPITCQNANSAEDEKQYLLSMYEGFNQSGFSMHIFYTTKHCWIKNTEQILRLISDCMHVKPVVFLEEENGGWKIETKQ